MKLRVTDCCGACKHTNSVDDFEAYTPYFVATTVERWCFKHRVPVIRESVCDDFLKEEGKGSVLVFKRVVTFAQKLQNILIIKKWMETNNVEELVYSEENPKVTKPNMLFRIVNDKLSRRTDSKWDKRWVPVSCKRSKDHDKLVKAYRETFFKLEAKSTSAS